jgi:hypothetical protein
MKNKKKHIISFFSLLFFLVLFIASTEDDSKTQVQVASAKTEYTISAKKLYSAYDANEVGADMKYKGKFIEVNGYIADIGKDLMDDIYVTLETGEYFGSVQCFFSDDYATKAAQLSKGQKITIKGMCDGLMMNVLMRGCIIL